jgi:two-component system response regulator MprA
MHILVVMAEPRPAGPLTRALRKACDSVETTSDGPASVALAGRERYDLILLSAALPPPGGIEICRRMRAAGISAPIMMLSPRSAAADRVAGLDAGADDCVSEPVAIEELLARFQALLRRRRWSHERVSGGTGDRRAGTPCAG